MKLSREVTICNDLGMHARAAAKLVDCANRYKSQLHLEHRERRVNGKSIMGVLMLAAAKGASVTVLAEGPDAEAALAAVCALVEDGFGENGP